MFTGLIERVGKVAAQEKRSGGGMRLRIMHAPWDSGLETGESVAVNGACLTVTAKLSDNIFECDCLDETLRCTAISTCTAGVKVNLERALQLGGRLGGHMVSGHVDGTGHVEGIRMDGPDYVVALCCADELLSAMVTKGSVAVNGISLTISNLLSDRFEVSIIPHTWRNTNLPDLKYGGIVNLETDLIGKYVMRYMNAAKATPVDINEELLVRSGFL